MSGYCFSFIALTISASKITAPEEEKILE